MNDLMRRFGLTLAVLFTAGLVLLACDATGGGDASASGSPSPKPSATLLDMDTLVEEFEEGEDDDDEERNVVQLLNTENGRFMARAKIRMDKMGGNRIDPVNRALAESRCTDCQTIAVALQVVIYKRGANRVTPQNVAIALNQQCTRCVTVALAYQYVIPVDNYKEVPPRVRELVREMDKELRYFEKVRSVNELDPKQAEARLQSVLDKFSELKQYLNALRDEKKTDASPSPSPSASPAASAPPQTSPTASPTARP